MKNAGALLLCLLVTGACGVGDDPTYEPEDHNPNKIVCSDSFKTTGSFVESAARPIDEDTGQPITGCWPVGTWTFTAQLDPSYEVPDITGDRVGDRCGEVAGTAKPEVMASYSFKVEHVPDDGVGEKDVYYAKCGNEYLDLAIDANNDMVADNAARCTANLGGFSMYRLKVTEGGGGECTGNLEIYDSTNKKYWNLHPAQDGTTIAGFGEFTEYINAQR